ncbi:MAG: MrcB family domain-containing protein [Pseudoramibacter sp.]
MASQREIMEALARMANPEGAENADKYEQIKEERARKLKQQRQQKRRSGGTVLASGHTADQVSPRPGHLSGSSHTSIPHPVDGGEARVATNLTTRRPTRQVRIRRTGTTLASGHSAEEVTGHALPKSETPEADLPPVRTQRSIFANTGTTLASGHTADEILSGAAEAEAPKPEPAQEAPPEPQAEPVQDTAPEMVEVETVSETITAEPEAQDIPIEEPQSETVEDVQFEEIPDEGADNASQAAAEPAPAPAPEPEESPAPPEQEAPEAEPQPAPKLSFSEQIKAAGGAIPDALDVEQKAEDLGELWARLNDYKVKCLSTPEMFGEGAVALPDALIDFFGAQGREKRVMVLFEGREYPSYLESSDGVGGYRLEWSKALSRKFYSMFPQYESFFDGDMDDEKQKKRPYLTIEKLSEDEFAAKLILPSDQGLTRKQLLFDLLGPGKSLANFTDSYDLVFLKSYFENIDNRWRSDVFVVAANVQKFYKDRIADGHDPDPKSSRNLEGIANVKLDAILDFLMDGPYQFLADQGLLSTSQEQDHFYFGIDQNLMDEMTMDDRNLIVSLLEQKIDYYFSRLDGPTLQENLENWVEQYGDYYHRDFRYSFKDVITEGIPGSIEGLKDFDEKRYRIFGFAGDDNWAEVPWVEIVDKQISRFPNTGVSVKYLLSKDSKKLYLALTVGYKTLRADIEKTEEFDPELDLDEQIDESTAEVIAEKAAEIRGMVHPGTFSMKTDEIDLSDPLYLNGVIFFREYAGVVPGEKIIEADLDEMLEVYNHYLHRCVIGDEKIETATPKAKAAPQEKAAAPEEAPAPEAAEAPETETPAPEEMAADLDTELDDDLDLDDLEDLDDDALLDLNEDEEDAAKAEADEASDAAPAEPQTETGEAAAPESEAPESAEPSESGAAEEVASEAAISKAMAAAVARKRETAAPMWQAYHHDAPQTAVQVVNTGGLTKSDLAAFQKAMVKSQLKAQKILMRLQEKENPAPEKTPRDRHALHYEEVLQDPPSDVVGLMRHIVQYINESGGMCTQDEVADLFLSIKSGSIPIITGVAGLGKAAFIRGFAGAVGANDQNGRFKMIPVRPSWQNANGLLGYTAADGHFVPGAMIDFVAAAVENPDKPYFLLLDEMCAAPIEKYFSEILSILNTRRAVDGRFITDPILNAEIFGQDEEARAYYGDLVLPQNLIIIGTISSDSGIGKISSRLIEQAAVIEMTSPDLTLTAAPPEAFKPIALKSDFFERDVTSLSQIQNHRKTITDMVTLLNVINEILKRAQAQIGFRVRDEICLFLYYNAEYGLMVPEKAIDTAIAQKMLPRISGTTAEIEQVLIELFKICAGTQDEQMIYHPIAEGSGLFPTSAAKLAEMAGYLQVDGQASFWKLGPLQS